MEPTFDKELSFRLIFQNNHLQITAAVSCSLDVVVKLVTEINNNAQISLQLAVRNKQSKSMFEMWMNMHALVFDILQQKILSHNCV